MNPPVARHARLFRGIAALAIASAVCTAGSLGEARAAADSPGAVTSAAPVRINLNGLDAGIPSRAWQLRYRSTDALGEPVTASALLVVPRRGDAATRPLIGMGHGTEGLADRCAPSRQYVAGTELESGMLALLLRRGWAVVIADGQGVGVPGESTYMVGQSAGRTMLDAMRAARALPDAGVPADSPTGVFGYSEGGATSVWTAELQPTYAPDVPLDAVVAGGTPADLRAAADTLNGSFFATFLFAAAAGFDAAYPELDLERFLTPRGMEQLRKLRSICTLQALPLGAFTSIDRWTTSNPLEDPAWQARLAENQAGRTAPQAPVYLFHGRKDEILPFAAVQELYRSYCALGVDATLRTYGSTHFEAYLQGAQAATRWLAERLRQGPGGGTCA